MSPTKSNILNRTDYCNEISAQRPHPSILGFHHIVKQLYSAGSSVSGLPSLRLRPPHTGRPDLRASLPTLHLLSHHNSVGPSVNQTD